MSESVARFFFVPKFLKEANTALSKENLIVGVELSDDSFSCLARYAYSVAVTRQIRVDLGSAKLYAGADLVPRMERMDPGVLEDLEARLCGQVAISGVIDGNLERNNNDLFFEIDMGKGGVSEASSLFIFTKYFRRELPSMHRSYEHLGGALFLPNPEPELLEFEIPVVRTSVSKATYIKVQARNIQEAEGLALNQAGDYDYSESEANYEVM